MINIPDKAISQEKGGRHRYARDVIARELEDYITTNHLARGFKLPSDPELAKRYGVSLKTANRAMAVLTKKGLVSRQRGSGTFVNSNRVSKQQCCIGLFLWHRPEEDVRATELHYAAYGYFIDILRKQFAEHDYAYDIFYDNPNRSNMKLLRFSLCKYDAIVFAAGMLDPAAEFLETCPVPMILIQDDVVHPGPWHQVVFDYQPGFVAALKHLLNQGHKKFFIMTNNDPGNSRRMHREDAVLAAAARLRIPAQDLIVHRGSNPIINSPILCGRDSAEYYCRNGLLKRPVISTSDFITYGFLSYMNEQKLKPGVDFKLISYDNLEKGLQNPTLKHGITAITHPQEQAAAAVIDLLESLFRTKANTDFYRTYFVPAKELVLRNSG
ncbi:MAG: GntR family transcriptional regulator [Lentisphaerae bacterium]|jgi:DNA-binding LacI/PurR family transcriptional regulator|nr:GntR family transcriptional regulator [Lentisphaerota bacterium]